MQIDQSVEARYWAKVQRSGTDECWLWLAFINPSGYGMIRIGRRMELSNRVSWTITNGPIPDGLHVLHRCDVRACCNPQHLFLGTNSDNIADKVRKGRSSFPHPSKQGERHHFAKLTAEAVAAIRSTDMSFGSGRRLAEEYGVSPATITNIRKGKVWKCLSSSATGGS